MIITHPGIPGRHYLILMGSKDGGGKEGVDLGSAGGGVSMIKTCCMKFSKI